MSEYDVLIVGTGGLTLQCWDMILEKYKNPAFFDNINNDKSTIKVNKNEFPVFHNVEVIRTINKFLVLIGDPKSRKKISDEFEKYSHFKELLVSRNFYEQFTPASNNWNGVVFPDCIIEPEVQLASHILINTRCSVHHGSKLGEYVTLAPNVTILGDCEIGAESFIGAGTIVREKTKIGSNCLIGMGSVVVSDIPDNSVAYGNPCKVIRKNE